MKQRHRSWQTIEDKSQYNVVLVISLDPTEITLPPSNIQTGISSNRTSIFLASNDEKVFIKEDFPQISENKSDDNDDPKNWSRKRKSFIIFIISSAGLIAPFSST
ncbi:9260_t:CDS:2 [Entrophospora sp. SA101]|nr:15780_t:CDS:2 [Entrophospora sp. SA101]CAJ0751174.1 756_t:CDS:2 [Entrophospora sp. SA101]CAJ0752164.1 9260_t:CDS:2 [Entrophospora sp. SA101]CAJ0831536.1 12874_t:CDS:2 [Entrophospora sp. SA101]